MATKLNIVYLKNLPKLGTPGSLYFVKDGRDGSNLLLAARNGTLCPVDDLFNIQIAEAPGKDGRDGVDGKDGRGGVDGKPGPKGDKGEPGDVLYIGPAELEAAVQKVREQLVKQRAEFKARVLDKISQCGQHPAASLAKVHLQNLLKETGL